MRGRRKGATGTECLMGLKLQRSGKRQLRWFIGGETKWKNEGGKRSEKGGQEEPETGRRASFLCTGLRPCTSPWSGLTMRLRWGPPSEGHEQ
ncbi:hypothetical protein NDU88_004636 [Pleurodeles waltl]|uniref:Uncharacterized protein n=1 Tax=Pleurodeles waltl TaxID=8319 RepID=A0AAV7QIZ6_PLEWA|nr:hypothetical protein NDU88_004636 [Pleurodeles waltl]